MVRASVSITMQSGLCTRSSCTREGGRNRGGGCSRGEEELVEADAFVVVEDQGFGFRSASGLEPGLGFGPRFRGVIDIRLVSGIGIPDKSVL